MIRALDEAFRAAADGRGLFVEDRAQARIDASPQGEVEVHRLRVTGVAFDGNPSLHLTDPSLPSLRGPLSRVLDEPTLPIAAWLDLARAAARGGVTARLVGFNQNVWVVDGAVVADIRRSARLELRSAGPHGGVLDIVLPESGTPDPGVLGPTVREHVLFRRDAVPVDPARDGAPLVFAPGAAGVVVHELVGHALEGDAADRGSRLSGRDDRFASARLRVIDDPARGRARWNVDDEGTRPRAVTLLEGGRVVGRLLDRAHAHARGERSTGHGRRGSYLDPVLPRMGCTYIDVGSDAPRDILRETPRGIYIHRLTSGLTDVRAGRATFVVTIADRIEGGALGRPLQPFVLELDAIDALASIDRVGHDLVFDSCVGSCVREGQPLAVSVGAPTVRLGVITVIV